MSVLKIFGAFFWHDSVSIVGNRDSLLKLRNIIDESLKDGYGSDDFIETDGEGYSVEVKLHDKNFGSSDWDGLPLHYIDERTAEYSSKEKEWENFNKLMVEGQRNFKINKIEEGKN